MPAGGQGLQGAEGPGEARGRAHTAALPQAVRAQLALLQAGCILGLLPAASPRPPEICTAFCAVVERGGWEKTCLQGFSQLDSGGPNPGESLYKQGNQQL